MDLEELVHTTGRVLGHAGGAPWYFAPETLEAGKAIGLDGFRFYVLGRGGVLGDVGWRIVHSAFGYFSPGILQVIYTTARERCATEVAVATHLGACADFGRRALAGVDEATLRAFSAAAEQVADRAAADSAGLTLFAGYVDQARPDDAAGRAMHMTAVLRELRGSVHLAAVVAADLPTPVAHAIRRPGDVELFGYKPGEVPEPTDDDRRKLAAADAATDAVMARLLGTLDEPGRAALESGTAAIAAAVPGGH